jgi:hypothetical protein
VCCSATYLQRQIHHVLHPDSHLPGGANSFSACGNGTVKTNYNMLMSGKRIQLMKQDIKDKPSHVWRGTQINTRINAVTVTSFFC